MAIVSAFTLIRSLALFHITLAFFFFRNPKIIAEQNIVFLMGEAMQLVSRTPAVHGRSADPGPPAYASRILQALRNHSFHRRPPRLPRNERPHLAHPV